MNELPKQFVFVLKDIPGYSKGAIAAQAIHASVASLEAYKDHKETKTYLQNLSKMATIVLETNSISNVEEILKILEIDYYIWEEDELKTAIATRPVIDNLKFKNFRKNFKLLK